MKTRESPCRTVYVELLCEADGCDGIMVFEGRTLMSSPQQYPHRCPKCGAKHLANKVYPTIEHRKGTP
jgi:hypothetical protein